MKPAWLLIAAVGAQISIAQAQTPTCSGQTGKQATALAELFTSEGCDSCPPADKWLGTLKADARAVPIAWHVDYWDYIGWKDRFARADAGTRHRKLVALQGDKAVYTPQLIVSGKTQRWGNVAGLGTSAAPTVSISLQHGTPVGRDVDVQLKAASNQAGNNEVFVALLEDGLSSEVKAGENRGVTLRHDHVVRTVSGPIAVTPQGTTQSLKLALPADARPDKVRVVAWAQEPGGVVLNAVAAQCAGQ